MRLLLYEWVTGGGMVGVEGGLPQSLLREGLAMVQALADDAARSAGVTPVLLRDLRLPLVDAAGGEVVEVGSRAEHDATLRRLAAECDGVVVIAPEIDGALTRVVRLVESSGGRLLSPGAAFVELASNKQSTAEALREAGVPTPEAVLLESGAALPNEFPYPGVVKPLDGAGSQDVAVVAHALDRPPAYAWKRRLERFVRGVPASVAVIGVAGGEPVTLPPCRQRISSDGRLAYLGGSSPLAGGLAERAERLAHAAIAAAPPLVGMAGVDLILGDDPAGEGDAVIEINPRLTTSYVGLRRIVRGGLAKAMIDAAAGDSPRLEVEPRPIAWDADGAVYWQ